MSHMTVCRCYTDTRMPRAGETHYFIFSGVAAWYSNGLKVRFLCRFFFFFLTKYPMNQKKQTTAFGLVCISVAHLDLGIMQIFFSQDESSWMGEHLSTSAFTDFQQDSSLCFSWAFEVVPVFGFVLSVILLLEYKLFARSGYCPPRSACIYWNSVITVLKHCLYSLGVVTLIIL